MFSKFRLEINWDPGKTEALLVLRGSKACQVLQLFRKDGRLQYFVPLAKRWLNIVDSYKHLGLIVSSRRGSMPYASSRCSTAMASYSPIARRIVGARSIGLWLKLVFLRSLILSTLTFNVHVRVLCSKAFATISCVYMRFLRRIAGEMRFSSDGNATDL